MSHLLLPRIHFKGECIVNVSTANNDDVLRDLVDVANVTVDIKKMTNMPDFQAWVAQVDPNQEMTNADLFLRWAADINSDGKVRAGWNYSGDNSCRLSDVKVTGVELSGIDNLIAKPTEEPLIGAVVNFFSQVWSNNMSPKAVMVDVNPEGILSSQIFCDLFQIKSSDDSLSCEGPPTRFYSRWHHPWRNLAFPRSFRGASAVWCAAIPNEELVIKGTGSPVLNALREAKTKGHGLFIRFCTYGFKRDTEYEELASRVGDGPPPASNFARGHVLGTIGTWNPDREMESTITGRLLYPSNELTYNDSDFFLGPIVAHFDSARSVITLDTITTFPEIDEHLTKIDRNNVLLKLHHEQSEYSKTFSPIPYENGDNSHGYNKVAYEAKGGIIDIKVDDEEAEYYLKEGNGQLCLTFEGVNHEKLVEVDFAVETDQRGIYLQEGGKEETLNLRVFRKGKPAEEAVKVRLEQYIMTNVAKNPVPIPAKPAPKEEYIVKMSAPNMSGDSEILIEAGGIAQVTLTPEKSGTCVIRFVLVDQPGGKFRFTFTTSFFTNVRVLPEDNYDEKFRDRVPTFQDIFDEVLCYYYLLYPAMRFINLSDEATVRRHAHRLKELVSKEVWHRAKYMPVTRELSDGKRKLLERWCESVLAENDS